MSSLKKNKIIQSALLLMLLSAFLHMGLLAIHFLMTLDAAPFNFFRIIGLDYFFPDFVLSSFGNYVASVLVIVLYIVIYVVVKKRSRE